MHKGKCIKICEAHAPTPDLVKFCVSVVSITVTIESLLWRKYGMPPLANLKPPDLTFACPSASLGKGSKHPNFFPTWYVTEEKIAQADLKLLGRQVTTIKRTCERN